LRNQNKYQQKIKGKSSRETQREGGGGRKREKGGGGGVGYYRVNESPHSIELNNKEATKEGRCDAY